MSTFMKISIPVPRFLNCARLPPVPHPIHHNAAMKKPYVRKRQNYSGRIRYLKKF